MTDVERRTIVIRDIFIPSLRDLYKLDYHNIKIGASERNICARLAHHMENRIRMYGLSNSGDNLFEHYFVDVEYNRTNSGGNKAYYNKENHLKQNMVSDLLIQSRSDLPNLLAIEMKRKGNYDKVKEDKERLKAMVSKIPPAERGCVYDTLVGAFVKYSDEGVVITLYSDIEGHGESIADKILVCSPEHNLNGLPSTFLYISKCDWAHGNVIHQRAVESI